MADRAIPLNQLPSTPEELARCLADPEWRLFSGCLYKIMIKGDDGEDALVMPFKPNAAQRRFIRRLWHRNLILKARQLGFTTLIAILWLDHALPGLERPVRAQRQGLHHGDPTVYRWPVASNLLRHQ